MNLMPKILQKLTYPLAMAAIIGLSPLLPCGAGVVWAQGNSGQETPGQRGRENAAEQAAESAVEKILGNGVEKAVDAQVNAAVERGLERRVGQAAGSNASDRAQERRQNSSAPGQIEKVESSVERSVRYKIALDSEGFPRVRNRWLIMTDEATLKALESEGYQIEDIDRLDGLDVVMVEVVEPEGVSLEKSRRQGLDVVSKTLEVDYDHLYKPEDGAADGVPKPSKGELSGSSSPKGLLSLPKARRDVTIGVIDSAVDQNHSVFSSSKLTFRDFVETGGNRPLAHGTAVASILVGHDSKYSGLIANANVLSAGVFFEDKKFGQRASVKSLVRAINWMAEANVDVVNVSLTGPQNRILEIALKKLREKGALVVAAVGNEGPAAKPLYPAAYDFVIAVTATNAKNYAYFKANRGEHVDIAAPGVAIRHAKAGGGFSESTGTSYAAPFVSAYLAYALSSKKKSSRAKYHDQILRSMYTRAKDLGDLGHDEVYGHGLVQAM